MRGAGKILDLGPALHDEEQAERQAQYEGSAGRLVMRIELPDESFPAADLLGIPGFAGLTVMAALARFVGSADIILF